MAASPTGGVKIKAFEWDPAPGRRGDDLQVASVCDDAVAPVPEGMAESGTQTAVTDDRMHVVIEQLRDMATVLQSAKMLKIVAVLDSAWAQRFKKSHAAASTAAAMGAS